MDDDDGGDCGTVPVSRSSSSLRTMNTSVPVPEENLIEQRDEVLAIQSIYDDGDENRITVSSEPDERGHGLFHIQISVPVVPPSEVFQVDLFLPVSENSSPSQSEKQSPRDDEELEGAVGGEVGPGEGTGKQAQEEGTTALIRPPEVGKGVALQRSVSGERWTGSFQVRHLHPLTLYLTLPPNYPSEAPPAFALSSSWLRDIQLGALCKQLDSLWEASPNMPIIFSWVDWLEKESLSCLGLMDKLVLMPESEDNKEEDDRAMSECTDVGEAVHTLLQYNNQKEAIEFCKSMQECCLCFEEKTGTKFFRLEPCKHHFCFDCIATHCDIHVTAGTIQLLTCPDIDCKTVITPDVLQTVLSPDNFIRWETLSLQRTLDEMDDVVYCPRCQSVVIREKDANLNLAYCLVCCFSFCTECDQPWHRGTPCISELERLEVQAQRLQNNDVRAKQRYEELKRQAEERATTMVHIKTKTRPCPHCKIPVEKIEGCNKMTCRCGKYFCWLCGKAINGYDHFTKGSCVLFRYQPVTIQTIPQRRPPDALLWMQAQAELQGNNANMRIRCVQCKQTNFKLDRNNHIRCWNCKSHICFYCRSRISGVITQHFMSGSCPQHS